jgi:hypothetical protein
MNDEKLIQKEASKRAKKYALDFPNAGPYISWRRGYLNGYEDAHHDMTIARWFEKGYCPLCEGKQPVLVDKVGFHHMIFGARFNCGQHRMNEGS